jgi:hypothetical protein
MANRRIVAAVNVTDVLWDDETLVAGEIMMETPVLSSSLERRTAKKTGPSHFQKDLKNVATPRRGNTLKLEGRLLSVCLS